MSRARPALPVTPPASAGACALDGAPPPVRATPAVVLAPDGTLPAETTALLATISRARDASVGQPPEVAAALHACELVRWLALGQWGLGLALVDRVTLPDGQTVRHVAGRIFSSALQDARDARLAWTPTLDRLVTSRFWETLARRFEAQGRRLMAPEAQAATLVPWIAAQRDPAAFAPLLAFEAPVIRRLVAAHARCLTPALVAEGLLPGDTATPTVVYAAAGNAALDDPTAALLATRIAARYLDGGVTTRDECTAAYRALRALGLRAGGLPAGVRAAARRLARETAAAGRRGAALLVWDGGATTRDLLAAVRAVADLRDDDAASVRGHAAAHPAATDAVWRRVLPGGGVEAQAVVQDALVVAATGRAPGFALALCRWRPRDTRLHTLLVERPWVTPDALRHLAATSRSTEVKAAIAARVAALPAAEALPDVVDALLASTSPAVLAPLLPHADARRWRRTFRRVAAADPNAAADALSAGRPTGVVLTRADVVALLGRCDAARRRTLIAALHAVAPDLVAGAPATLPAPH